VSTQDDKYELDMLLECNKAAIRRMKPVATRILEMRPDEKALYRMAPDVLKPIHMRVIEKIYGEQVELVARLCM
jgi:paired amphipathic helix protein Sin3a